MSTRVCCCFLQKGVWRYLQQDDMSRGTEGQKEGNEDVGVSKVDFDCMLLPICSLRTRLFTKGIDDAYLEEEREI
jgi:hypothetical protein